MSTHVKFTNTTRGSFRRAGIRFPVKANGSIIKSLEELEGLTEAQKAALQNEPRLLIEPCEDPDAKAPSKKDPAKAKTKVKAKGGNKKAAPSETSSKAELAHETAMTAARKIEDPVKRQAAQTKANAALAEAQQD